MEVKKILFRCILVLAGLLMILILIHSLTYGANYKMVCDDLDQTGGESSSPNFNLKVSSVGQSSPIGIGSSTQYKIMAGYVYSTFVQHGDVNADGVIDVGDVVYLINYLFKGGLAPNPLLAGDATCDGTVDVGDVVYLINYLFKNGPAPDC